MSSNNLIYNDIREDVDAIRLSTTLRQEEYSGLFYDHLTWMLKFRLLSNYSDMIHMRLNTQTYMGLEQFIFENTNIVENDESDEEINWDMIEDAKILLKKKLKDRLVRHKHYEMVIPLINFSVANFERFLIYKSIHPNSSSNPWEPSRDILFKNGCLVSLSDDKTTALKYNVRLDNKMHLDDVSQLFVLASSGKDQETAMRVDDRNNTQGLAYKYLKENASGEYNKKPSKEIALYLNQRHRRRMTEYNLRNYVLLPLKRAGLIGSNPGGYFFICDANDLQNAYDHHKDKIEGMKRTLDMYRAKAIQKGWPLKE